MAVEEELKKDHSDMQAVVDSKQKIIEAQVCQDFSCERLLLLRKVLERSLVFCLRRRGSQVLMQQTVV